MPNARVKMRLTRPILAASYITLLAGGTGPSVRQPTQTTAAVGRIAATLDVSDNGTIGYRIPLVVPPGRRGMQPALALVYSSGAGDGIMGIGWNIAGFSEVSRCPRVPARNGVRRQIAFVDPEPGAGRGGRIGGRPRAEDPDEYCLDGEWLMLVSGQRGQDGAEYRTEQESFRRVVGIGSPHRTFRVFDRDGVIRDYGEANKCHDESQVSTISGTCTALLYARGGVIRAWLLARASDRFGNYMTYEYGRISDAHVENFDGGNNIDDDRLGETSEFLPQRIRYTGHEGDGLLPQRSILFDYEQRPDSFSGYAVGLHVSRSWRLKRVISHIENIGVVREYRIAYTRSAATGRSRVSTVLDCTGAGVCGQPTRFDWSPGINLFSMRINTHIPAPALGILANRRFSMRDLMAADFTGDGLADLAFPRDGTWRLVTAHGQSSDVGWVELNTGITAIPEVSAQVIDYNQDGRQDLFLVDNTEQPSAGTPVTFFVLIGSPTGFTEVDTGIEYFRPTGPFSALLTRVHLVDLDGDGIQDLLTCGLIEDGRAPGSGPHHWKYRIHTGERFGEEKEIPFFPERPEQQGCRDDKTFLVDVDGDGSTNLLVASRASYWAAIPRDFRTNGWNFRDTRLPSFVGYFDGARAADVNGDGLDDAVWQFQGQQTVMQVWFNTGRGFVGGSAVRQHAGADIIQAVEDDRGEFERAILQAQPFDANLDGRTDLLIPAVPCFIQGNRATRTVVAHCNEPGRIGTTWSILRGTGDRVAFDEAGFPLTRRSLSIPYVNTDPSGVVYDAATVYQRPRIVDVDGNTRPDLVLVEDECELPRPILPPENSRPRRPPTRVGPEGDRTGTPVAPPPPPRPGCFVVYLSTGSPPDLIYGVQEGFLTGGTEPPFYSFEIDYEPTRMSVSEVYSDGYMTTTDAFFTMPRPACTATLPCRRPMMMLPSRVRADRGPNVEPNELRYTWHDARFDRQGRGFLGFGERTVSQTFPPKFTVVRFDNTTREDMPGGRYHYPYHGANVALREKVFVENGRAWRRSTGVTYATRSVDGGQRSFTFLSRSITREEEVAGSGSADAPTLLLADTLRHFVDDFANDTLTIHAHSGVATERIASSYQNDTGAWILGLLRQQTILSTVGSESQRRVTAMEYDATTGAPLRSTRAPDDQARARTLERVYDQFGNVTKAIDRAPSIPTARATTTEYLDAEHVFPTRVTNALGHVTAKTFDPAFGLPLTSTDPNNVVSTWKYDGFGRLIEQSVGGGATSTVRYDWVTDGTDAHLRTSTRSPTRPTTVIDYDRLARPVRERITRLDGRVAEFTRVYGRDGKLLDLGRAHFVGEPALTPERFIQDGRDRLTRHRRSDGSEIVLTYTGRVTEIRDARGGITRKGTNALGQIITMRDPLGSTTRYTYGPFGLLRRITDGAGNVTAMTYDAYGRLDSIRDPNAGLRTYGYDAFDRRVTERDALSRVREMTYDDLDRVTRRKDSDGVATLVYDAVPNGLGNLAEARSAWGHVERYAYDASGRLSSHTQQIGNETYVERLRYDDAGRPWERELMSSGWQAPIAFVYDHAPNGSLRGVAERIGTSVTPIWNVDGVGADEQLLRERFGNGVMSEREYGLLSRSPTAIRAVSPAQTAPIQQLRFRYDANGNLTRREDVVSSVSERFGYDELDRLVADTICRAGCSEQQRIAYDPSGNITARTGTGSYGYLPGQPHAVTSVGVTAFRYDAVGNQIDRPNSKIDYAFFNLPKLIRRKPSGAEMAIEYDALQRLVVRTQGGDVEHRTPWLVRRRSGQAWLDEIPVRVAGRTVAVLVERFRPGAHQRERIFVHEDHIGSPATITDAAGRVLERPRFDPFGRLLRGDWGSSPATTPSRQRTLGFTGHLASDEFGLIDMGGRFYDPAIGRFLSVDPLVTEPFNAQALNRYSYVRNNPLTLRDPSGLAPEGEPASDDEDDGPPIIVTPDKENPEDCAALRCSFGMPFVYDRDHGLSPPSTTQKLALYALAPAGGLMILTAWESASMVSQGDYSMIPVVGSLQAFDEHNEAMYVMIEEGRPWAASGYAVLSVVDGAFAIADGLSLGAAGVARAEAKALAKTAAEQAPEIIAKVCNSFDGDTPVWTDQGLQPLRSLAPGVRVMGVDSVTFRATSGAVTVTHEHADSVLLRVVIGSDTLLTTPGHRFLTSRHDWVLAARLSVGDSVASVRGRSGAVRSIEVGGFQRTMYNLTVATHHTYSVGKGGWLVHNTNNCLVYIARNAEGALMYVGITNNFVRRSWQHLNTSKVKKTIETIEEFPLANLSRRDAHNVEQALLDLSGGVKNKTPGNANLVNQINSISPTKDPASFKARVARGYQLLQQAGWLP
jgi:RHS repeat-associated protein